MIYFIIDPVENRRIRPDSNGFSNETNNVDNQDTDNNIQEIELIIKPLPQVERRVNFQFCFLLFTDY